MGGRRHVAEVTLRTVVVVPVNPAQRRRIEVVVVVPESSCGAADQFGLLEDVLALGESVVDKTTDAPH